MYGPMNRLPSELLRLILEKVRLMSKLDCSNSFSKALRVCSKWNEAGENLLWTDVSLESDRLGQFLPQNHQRSASILSLTILIRPSKYEWPDDAMLNEPDFDEEAATPATITFWKALHQLPELVQRMGSLVSFSLKVCGYDLNNNPEGFWMWTKDICAIVDALPPSVKHLEIDTFCLDRCGGLSPTTSNHLCPSLSNTVFQLLTLRLRVSRLCDELFNLRCQHRPVDSNQPATNSLSAGVARITINTSDLETLPTTRPCAAQFPDGSKDVTNEHACDIMIKGLLNKIESYQKQCSCETQSMVEFIDLVMTPGLVSVKQKYYPAVLKRSFPPKKLTKYPFEWISWDPNSAFLRLQDSDGQDTEICGFVNDLVDEVETDPWTETEEGCRTPTSYFAQEPRFKEVRVKKIELLSREKYLAKRIGEAKLWRKERETGRWLLTMVETEDLEDVTLVERDRTDAEARRAQNT